jgi:RNA polymerase sigma-70 factor (ECF subfamily)
MSVDLGGSQVGAGTVRAAGSLEPSALPELDAHVVAAAAQGEHRAVADVLTAVHRLVLRYCRARVGSAAVAGVSAEDLAQDVCLRVLAALPRYQEQGRPFAAFAYAIAANAVTDVRRRAARRVVVSLVPQYDAPDRELEPSEHAAQMELRGMLRSVIGTLPPRLREVLVLRVALGMSVEATAQLLDISHGAVRLAQHRALSRLRRAAADDDLVELRLGA